MTINPSISNAVQTVSTPGNVVGTQTGSQATETDVNNSLTNINSLSDVLSVDPALDGDNTIKETFMSLAQTDIDLSSAELVVYDGEYSFAQTELFGVTSQLNNKRAALPTLEAQLATETAKTEIKTEINDAGNAVFTTSGGFEIETDVNQGGNQTWIRNAEGETMAHIWGDPHVDLNYDGVDDFHFGDNSSFMLEDGTEIFLNTENVAGTDEAGGYTHSKVFFTTGVYVKAGDNIVHTGDDTADDGNREAGFRNDVDASEMFRGTDADGAALFGLDSNGDAHIADANGNWNNLEDESWDGYLEDASFADQHGSASTFETETIMSNDQLSGIQGQIDALNTDIANLETQEAELTTSVARFSALRSSAQSSLEQAMSDYERYSTMDDSQIEDNDQNRFQAEQKGLELQERTGELGIALYQSELVDDEAFEALPESLYSFVDGSFQAREEQSTNEDEVEDSNFAAQGLTEINNDLEETAMVVGSVTGLINNSNFDEASMAYEDMVAAQMVTTDFAQGLDDLGQAGNDIDQAIINKDGDGLNTVLDGVTGITDELSTMLDANDFSVSYDELSQVLYTDAGDTGFNNDTDLGFDVADVFIEKVNLENSMSQYLATGTDNFGDASASITEKFTQNIADLEELGDEVEIDFSGIDESEASQLYQFHSGLQADFNQQTEDFLNLDTDLAREAVGDINVLSSVNTKIVSELERQFGFGEENA